MRIELLLNGQQTVVECDAGDYLLDVLRRCGCLSVKRCCNTGSCSTCTILMDTRPVLSCAMLAAKANGHAITTAEGMQAELSELADFLAAEGTEQCGFCSPGLALTILAMKKELKDPDDSAIRHYLAGNLCRCSGYAGQLRAIRKYLGVK